MALSETDLSNILSELSEVRGRWYEIGLELKVSRTDLDTIRSQSTNPRDALRNVVAGWLNNHPEPTWEVLVGALRSVEKFDLAKRLETRYKHTLEPLSSEVGTVAVKEVSVIWWCSW